MPPVTTPNTAVRIGFLLLPQFGLLSLSGALDVLAAANRILDEPVYSSVILATGAESAVSAGALRVPVDFALENASELDGIFVVSETPVPQRGFDNAAAWLQSFSSASTGQRTPLNPPPKLIGGIGTGTYLLARAGLLRGCRATIHWPYTSLLAEDFPDTVVSSNLFEIDRHRLTCAGGNASVDMMLNWLGSRHGEDLVTELLDHFGLERLRNPTDHQRVPLSARIGGGQPKLTEAVSLMEANYEEPLPTEEIARLVGVSRRQLERLFKQYLNSLPSRYYLELRLNRARHLLQQTSQSILQIGLSCGFSSGPHFSSAYRNHFSITPREQRSQRAARASLNNGAGA
ncbi:MAG: GlxA family transcriptional regulator [Betaproteobacteria bacterium]